MMTTIDSTNLTAAQVSKAVKNLLPLGSSIEHSLGLDNDLQLGLNIEAVKVNRGYRVRFKFYLTQACEIISFHPGSSIASRLLGMHPTSFVFWNDGHISADKIGTGVPQAMIVADVVSWCRRIIRQG